MIILNWLLTLTCGAYQIGQAPILDSLLRHNILIMWLETYGVKLMSVFPGIQFTGKRMQERKEEHKARDSKRLNGGVIHDVKELQENLLDRFFRAENDSDHMTENEVRGLTLTIVFAGSKTT